MTAILVGKGPSAKSIIKKNYPESYVIAINQACKLIDDPDYVFMNDIDSLKGITSEDIKGVKCFIIPEYPHKNEKASVSVTKNDFIQRLRQLDYTGNIQTFNLHTGPVKKDALLTVTSDCVTTGHTAIYYMSVVHDVKVFETYGFLVLNKDGYHNRQFYEDTNHYTEDEIKCIYKKKFFKHEQALSRIVNKLGIQVKRF